MGEATPTHQNSFCRCANCQPPNGENNSQLDHCEAVTTHRYRYLSVAYMDPLLTRKKGLKMPFPPLSDNQKNRIQQYINNGQTVAFIANTEGVGKSSVYRIIENLHAFGTHTAPRVSKRGRPLAIPPAARIGLRTFVENKPWAHQDEIQHDLFDRFGLRVSRPTISNTLHAMKISRKDLRRLASERSQTVTDHSHCSPNECQDRCICEQLAFIDSELKKSDQRVTSTAKHDVDISTHETP